MMEKVDFLPNLSHQEDIQYRHVLLDSIKACGKHKDLDRGIQMHAEFLKRELLQKDIYLSTSLVSMYAKCGAFAEARKALHELPLLPDVAAWNALIAGYSQHRRGFETLKCFEQMQSEGFLPDAVTFTCILKACGSVGLLQKGEYIHAGIHKRGSLRNNVLLGNALVDMYVKCGVLPKAQEAFNDLPMHDVATWNALIAGYAQHALGNKAVDCFTQMQGEGMLPDAITFTCVVKACGGIGSLVKGEEVHAEIRRRGLLKTNMVLGSALIGMYGKCGAIFKALEVFHELPERNVVSWTALIAAYAQNGLADEALKCYSQMQDQGVIPNEVTFSCVLKACGTVKSFEKGEEIHAEINKQGLLVKNIVLGTSLVDMYAKCGVLSKAQEVFDKLPIRNAISWNVLIAGYAQYGFSEEALTCFSRMKKEGFSPNAATFACILKACGKLELLEMGEQIHVKLSKDGLLENNITLGNALVDMYAKCGMLVKARKVFDDLPKRDVISWNALISGYVQHGLGDEALSCFVRMQAADFEPDAITFSCILKACGNTGAVDKGEEIHAEVRKRGLITNNPVIGNAVVDMYAKCDMLLKAQQVFDELPTPNIVSWNAMISGYVQNGFSRQALDCFARMRDNEISPNEVTFTCILKACGNLRAVQKGEEIYAELQKQRFLERNNLLGNALLGMYVKCGEIEKAQEVFDKLPVQDVVSWTTLITGYADHGLCAEALDCFSSMLDEGLLPDAVTHACILKVCGNIGLIHKGEEIHMEVKKHGLLRKDIVLGTALVDMYAKCGSLSKAQEVFDELPLHDAVAWNSLIAAYAQLGYVGRAFVSFNNMITEGIMPDMVTFVVLLTACSHSGLVEEGQFYYHAMTMFYRFIPTREHHTCMVDLFGRAGHLEKAAIVGENVPPADRVCVLSVLLGACQKWVNIDLGRWAFENLVQLDENNVGALVCMSNMYSMHE